MNTENKTEFVTLADFLEVNNQSELVETQDYEANTNGYLDILFACAEAQNG